MIDRIKSDKLMSISFGVPNLNVLIRILELSLQRAKLNFFKSKNFRIRLNVRIGLLRDLIATELITMKSIDYD